MKDMTEAMLGSSSHDVRQPAAAAVTISSKEMSWAASVKANSCPVSSLGRNPLGMRGEQHDRQHDDAERTPAMVKRRWRSTQRRLAT